jgi:predicted ATP-dependent protease
MPVNAGLPPEALRTRCDPAQFDFRTSEELEPVARLIGQERAIDALAFGADIARKGFNLFVLGPVGSGRHSAVKALLEERAAAAETPGDWVYVNNFDDPRRPVAIGLPAGEAVVLRDRLTALIDDLATAVPALFESDDYRNRRRAIDEEIEGAQEAAFEELKARANAEDIGIIRTPLGFALAPILHGQVLKPEVFNALPEAEREAIGEKIAHLQKELEAVLQKMPELEKQRRDRIRSLNAELAQLAVGRSFSELAALYADHAAVARHLEAVRRDLIDNIALFLKGDSEEQESPFAKLETSAARDPRFRRYMVNVMVSNATSGPDPAGAPIIAEDLPTLANLAGRVEHISHMGTLVTDFMLIKSGALHRANGGYLVLDAHRVLREPFSWEALKRCLRAGEVRITSVPEEIGLTTTVSLEPDPIPISVKVVLVGERLLYYLLVALDPDFETLFKVAADFEDEVVRDVDTTALYCRLIASVAKRAGLKALDAAGMARMVEEASRLAEDAERLTLRIGVVGEILNEADHWAGVRGGRLIEARDVEKAVDERLRRSSRIRDRSLDMITRDIVLIDTDGHRVGQINGLSVVSMGKEPFGRPSRITARVRMGTGKVIDIEREVELGGPLHSKGVLILSAFLSARFALEEPVSLWASLVFEQSYGGVEGDSASSAELYALLSALAETPIFQGYAVTGSVNQLGEVQAIGGVNAKIEGFFDVCKARGLTGRQGVLIPKSNVKHLMLRPDVVEAARRRKFSVIPVSTIDEGIALLTGIPAGERGGDGRFPDGTVNARVEARLKGFAEARRRFGQKAEEATAAEGRSS